MNRSYLNLLALAGTTSTLFISGCACPVAEREIIGESIATECPGVYRTRTVRRVEPVGERIEIRRSSWRAKPCDARYYNPMTQSFERRWPFGPYDSSRN